MYDHKRVGFLTCRLKDCKSDVSRSLPVPRSTVNFDQISQAIWDCRQNHRGCRTKRTASPEPIEISLIDCYTRELIQTTSLKRYVALSYVWGDVSAGDLDRTTLPPTLPRTLPRTHEDAIQVTKALGFQYLWFDQFCVNQCDHAIKHRQLRTMGRVYEDAMVTLVAASGPDANAGLPGAPSHPRKGFLPSVVIDGCIISEEAMPIDLEIQKSDWARRGWTFQEQFFSRKYVVFTADQVSFECRKTKYSSRFGMYNLAKPLPELNNLYSRLHERIDGDSSDCLLTPTRTLGKYQYLVNEYWPRRLTFQEDGINAFTGALEYLKVLWNAELVQDARAPRSHESKMTFTAGIPHLLETERMPLSRESDDLRLFVQGLSWYFEHSSKRRKFFPSWCWAGWIPLDAQRSNLFWHSGRGDSWLSIREVFFRNAPDIDASGAITQQETAPEPVPIAEYDSSNVPEAVIFVAPLVDPSNISWWLGEEQPTLWGCQASWFLADETLLHNTDFLADLLHGVYCLIALKHEEREFVRTDVFLLVRRASQDQHERIGLVTMEMDIDKQPGLFGLERRTWELI